MEWVWVTTAQVISNRPCRLLGLVVTPSSTNSVAKVYDGENTTAPEVFETFLDTKRTWQHNFGAGLKLNRGLYIGSFTSITGILVHWELSED